MSSIITLIDKPRQIGNRGALEYASYIIVFECRLRLGSSHIGRLDPSWGFVIYARTSRQGYAETSEPKSAVCFFSLSPLPVTRFAVSVCR